MYTAHTYIPLVELSFARYVAWAAYGYVQGQQMTGIWVRTNAPTLTYQTLSTTSGHRPRMRTRGVLNEQLPE